MLEKVNNGITYVRDILINRRSINKLENISKIYKYAIIIPVHEQKANWLIGFLNSYMLYSKGDDNFEIILAVSNQHEYTLFNRLLTNIYPELPFFLFNVEKYLIEEIKNWELIDKYRSNSDRCIVNIKKFLTMYWASMQNYKYIMVKDCDSYFYKNHPISLFDRAINNYNQNLYLGSNISTYLGGEGFSRIIETCAKSFNHTDFNLIKQATKDFTIYTWFFDIPFYKIIDLKDFFNLIAKNFDGLDKWLLTIGWHHFEHLIFIFYRILYNDANLTDISDGISVEPPENLALEDILSIYRKYNYCPLWVSGTKVLHQVETLEKLNNTSLLYHMDRF